MKNMNKKLITGLLLLVHVLFASCGKGSEPDAPVVVDKMPQLTLSTYSVTVEAEVGDCKEIEVRSDSRWNVTGFPVWLSVSPTKSQGDGQVAVSVAAANPDAQTRTATLVFTATSDNGKTKEQTLQVTQKPAKKVEEKKTLDVDATSLSFDSDGGSRSVKITGNDDWTAKSTTSWCTLSSASGAGAATLTVRAAKNTSYDSRSATVTIKGTQSGASFDIRITQSGQDIPTLDVNRSSLSFSSAAGSDTFEISGTDSWTVTSSSTSWCTVSPTSGTGNKKVTVSVKANTDTTSRSATIKVKGADSGKTFTIEITQAAAESDNDVFGRDEFDDDKTLL